MRMWMVNPEILCRKHLLGEHVELHMLVGWIIKGKSIQGYLDTVNIKKSLDDLSNRCKECVFNEI